MLKTLIQKELLQQLHSRKFIISAVISICLLLLCLHISAENYQKKQTEYLEICSRMRQDLLDRKNQREVNSSGFDQAVYRKPTPLSIFCQGKENDFGDMAPIGLSLPFMAQPINKTSGLNEFDMEEVVDDLFAQIDFVLAIKLLF